MVDTHVALETRVNTGFAAHGPPVNRALLAAHALPQPVVEGALKAALSPLHAQFDAGNPGPITELALVAG
jgi:hypothetical protein